MNNWLTPVFVGIHCNQVDKLLITMNISKRFVDLDNIGDNLYKYTYSIN